MAVLRSVLTASVLVALYFLLPLDRPADTSTILALAVGFLAFGFARQPGCRDGIVYNLALKRIHRRQRHRFMRLLGLADGVRGKRH